MPPDRGTSADRNASGESRAAGPESNRQPELQVFRSGAIHAVLAGLKLGPDHPHWFPYFQTIGLFEQKDERYPGDVNPFLHVNLHMVIAFQLNQRRPKIITRYYQERIKKGESPHEIIHQLIEVFQRQLVWTITQGDRDGEGAGKVDLAAYGKTLKTLMRLSRRRLWQRLGAAEPPPLHPEADLATEL